MLFWSLQMTFTKHLKELQKVTGLGQGKKFLDVGAYIGVFVEVAREHGWDATGVEPSEWAAKLAQEQGLPVLDRGQMASAGQAVKGAYVLSDVPNPQIILMASGSEVHIILEAQKTLAEKGIAARVVSMPSWELFDAMPVEYRHSVLPPKITARVALEAGVTQGWERYVGPTGVTIGIDHFAQCPDERRACTTTPTYQLCAT